MQEFGAVGWDFGTPQGQRAGGSLFTGHERSEPGPGDNTWACQGAVAPRDLVPTSRSHCLVQQSRTKLRWVIHSQDVSLWQFCQDGTQLQQDGRMLTWERCKQELDLNQACKVSEWAVQTSRETGQATEWGPLKDTQS